MKKLLLIITVIFSSLYSSNVFAANEARFTIYPAYSEGKWLRISSNSNQNIDTAVILENLTSENIQLALNFKELSGTEKNPEIQENAPYQDLGNWLTISGSEFPLNPRQKLIVPLQIKIPTQTPNQLYQGVLLATESRPSNLPSMNIATRIGTRIYLEVDDSQIIQANNFQFSVQLWQILAIISGMILFGYSLLHSRKNNEK